MLRAARDRAAARLSCPPPPGVPRWRAYTGGALKDIVWLRSDGGEMDPDEWANAELRSFGCTFDAADARAGPQRFALLINGAPHAVMFTLPAEHGGPWRGLLDTASQDGATDRVVSTGASWELASRSLILLASDGDAVAERAS